MEENILNSIKLMLGSEIDYDHFDEPIIMCINSCFGVLFQLGVGPQKKPFKIEDGTETWDDFMVQPNQLDSVKTYIYLKVKLQFDPPTSSFVLKSFEDMTKEYEWRLNVSAETPI